MLSYRLKCRKNTENINSRVSKLVMKKIILSKCTICGAKNPRFIKNQEASGLLSNLGIKTSLG